MPSLEETLSALQTEQKGFHEKAAKEQKEYGSMLSETKTAMDKLQKQVDAIDQKLAERPGPGVTNGKSALHEAIKENESVARLLRDKSGRAVIHLKADAVREMQTKTVITETYSGAVGNGETAANVGFATTGVLPIDRTGGIVQEARRTLRVRNVLSARPTTMALVDFVRVNQPMSPASPVPETQLKPEQNVTFQAISEKVKTLASWIPASKQILDDWDELMGFLTTSLRYYTDLAEEIQLLSGDGTGENLHGLIPQATAYATTFFAAAGGYNRIDLIGAAVEQITAANELPPTFIIVNPADWWRIRLTKDGFGRYILGDPQSAAVPNIFGLDVVPTSSIAPGSFLVGSGSPVAAEIRDRMEANVTATADPANDVVLAELLVPVSSR